MLTSLTCLNRKESESEGMETEPPPTQKKTRTVLIHLSEVDYKRTLAAADECGLQTGPWLRMNLLKILKDVEKNGRGE